MTEAKRSRTWLVVAIALIVALVGGGFASASVVLVAGIAASSGDASSMLCGTPTTPQAPTSTQDEQVDNARAIDQAAQDVGLSGQASRVAIIAAYGESTLFNLDYGDNATNPDGSIADSLGLFQQQPSQGWGTVAQVMDPIYAATSFLAGPGHDGRGGLMAVSGWVAMEPTRAIHLVQINADPNHYARYYAAADAIIAAAGIDISRPGSTAPGSAGGGAPTAEAACGELGQNVVSPDGWSAPSNDPVTSNSGPRVDPITGEDKYHWGIDYSAGCGTPIYAANGGEVTLVDTEPWGAWEVRVDSGDGYVTRYVHMFEEGIFVDEGDQVAAGEQIAVSGNSGHSTGCHLHFEIFLDGENIQPELVLAQAGLPT